MYKKILVPTDASEYSKRALTTALELAKCFDSEIILMHVTLTVQAYWGYTISYGVSISQETLAKNGQLALDAALMGVSTEDVKLRTVLEVGYPVSKILEEIDKENVDLVVMGSHGYGPLIASMLGSVSQRVVQKASCPVLIVK